MPGVLGNLTLDGKKVLVWGAVIGMFCKVHVYTECQKYWAAVQNLLFCAEKGKI